MMMMTTRLWRSLVAIVFAMTLLAGWLAGEARGQEIEMQTTPGQIKAAQISPEILKLLPPSLMFSPATVDVVIRHEDSSHGKEASSSVNSSSEAAWQGAQVRLGHGAPRAAALGRSSDAQPLPHFMLIRSLLS